MTATSGLPVMRLDELDVGHVVQGAIVRDVLTGVSVGRIQTSADVVERFDERALSSERPSGPQAELVSLADVSAERVGWLWPGRLPAGKLVTLDGDPGLGKSTLAITFAAHVSTGSAWPDHSSCPLGAVVVLSAEDGMADTIRPRLDAAGGDPTRVHCLTSVRTVTEDGEIITRPPTLADVAQIREAIERTGARLLIVDVLMAYLPNKTDSHRDQDVRAVLHRVAEVGEATGCTVLLLRHLNKSGAGPAMYRGGGSIGIVGAARAGYVVAPDPDDETGSVLVLACVKANLALEPPSLTYRLESAPGSHVARVVWGEASQHSAADLLRSGDPQEDRTERDDAAAFILDYLTEHGGSALARDVQTAGRKHNYSKTTMHRAADRLRVRKRKDGMRGPWYWDHPDDGPEDPTEGPEDPSSQTVRPSGPSVGSSRMRGNG
ncbi:MAG: AAA family ATPase [Pseudonocardiaceae bacterium]